MPAIARERLLFGIENPVVTDVVTVIDVLFADQIIALVSVGVINFFSRNDPGSKALRAVMIGNIFLHLVGGAADIYDYTKGMVQLSSILRGGVVHILMLVGFVYFFFKMPKVGNHTLTNNE